MCLLRFWFPSSADYTNCINKKEKHFIMTEVFVSVKDHDISVQPPFDKETILQ